MRSNEPVNKKEEKVEEVVKKNEKKKNVSDDKKEKEKRRDSVTGSILDTSSSSSSSVDSDEIDATEHSDSKSAMTSKESKLQMNNHKVGDFVDKMMKRISAISNSESDEVSNSVVALNNDRNNKQTMNIDNGAVERNGPEISPEKSRNHNQKQGKKVSQNKLNNSFGQNKMFSNGEKLLTAVDESTKRRKLEVRKDGVVGTYSKLGAWTIRKEIMSNDGMETSNLLYMTDSSNKFDQHFTRWIQKYYDAAVNGDVEGFMIMFTSILQTLKKNNNGHYKRMSGHQLKEHVMNNVIFTFFNKSSNTSVLHHLASTKNTDHPCSMKNHGCCRLIKIILSMLPWENRRILLATPTKRTGKTALHLAAATGQLCQMQALMDFGAWPDFLDHSGRAPIHYAVMRNNLEMVKLLLWYGADISLREYSTTPLQLADCSPITASICEYLRARIDALEKIFMQWIRKYVRGVWTPIHAISDLHFARLSKACDSRKDASRNFTTKNRKIRINISGTRTANLQLKKCPLMLLFIVPTFYKGEDKMTDASNPQIFCAKLQNVNGFVVKLLPSRPLLSCSKWSVGIKSALEKPHNGYFYVYKLPENIEADSYTLDLIVELEELRFQAPYITLAIQAFACGPPDLEHYNELRGLIIHSNNKTKMD